MKDQWKNRWDKKYSDGAYAYGTDPNVFLKGELARLDPGTVLFPAEGEGRNAVFAAKLGWAVSAFDISAKGRDKAHRLAKDNKVTIDYQVGELPGLGYELGQFDAVALIYAHFPPEIKSRYHKLLGGYLRSGGDRKSVV